MKTIIRTVLCAVALMLTAACQKAVDPVNPVDEGKGTIDIRVNGLMGEYTQVDGTKSSMVNTVRISWENDDIVYVFDGTQCLGSLVASLEGDEDRYALLSTNEEHTVAAPAEGTTKLTLIHSPLLTEAPAVSDGAVSISLAEQSGAKAPFVAYATLDYTGTTITNAIVPFKFATSVIKVNCTGLTANTAIDNATLSNVNTACKLTLSGTAAPTVSGGANGTITRTGDTYFAAEKVNSEGVAVFQMAVPVLPKIEEEGRTLLVIQGSRYYEYRGFSKKALSAATSVNTVCQLINVPPLGALPGVFTVADYGNGNFKKVYFSQGNLWYGPVTTGATSTFNFESHQYNSTPTSNNVARSEDHISHFFWTVDYKESIKLSYNENLPYSLSDVFFTNADGFKVNVDGRDHPAWQTLSIAEWQYLLSDGDYHNEIRNGKSQIATVNGVLGCVIAPDNFTGTLNENETYANDEELKAAGDLIFLPAAGARMGETFYYVNEYGYYYTSSPYENQYFHAGQAFVVSFLYPVIMPPSSLERDRACSVRLVIDAE